MPKKIVAGVGFAPTHLTDQLMRLVRLTTPPSCDIIKNSYTEYSFLELT